MESIGRPSNDPFQMGVTRVIDPYLRRSISCKQNTNGELRYGSKYFYPTEGILCAFDRRNNQIIFNNHYDESYYIDNNTPQNGKIKKGDLLTRLQSLNKNHQQNGTQGISR